jgi:hypothetical protein
MTFNTELCSENDRYSTVRIGLNIEPDGVEMNVGIKGNLVISRDQYENLVLDLQEIVNKYEI